MGGGTVSGENICLISIRIVSADKCEEIEELNGQRVLSES